MVLSHSRAASAFEKRSEQLGAVSLIHFRIADDVDQPHRLLVPLRPKQLWSEYDCKYQDCNCRGNAEQARTRAIVCVASAE
jgi:hypothetical protein